MAHLANTVNLLAVARSNTSALLPAMLQGIKTQVRKVGRFRVPINGKDAALLVKLVERNFGFQRDRSCF